MHKPTYSLSQLLWWWIAAPVCLFVLVSIRDSPVHPAMALCVLVGIAACLRRLMPADRKSWGLAMLLAAVVAIVTLIVAVVWSR